MTRGGRERLAQRLFGPSGVWARLRGGPRRRRWTGAFWAVSRIGDRIPLIGHCPGQPDPLAGHRQALAATIRVVIALALALTGCAATGSLSGGSGSLSWEVLEAKQTWEEQGTRLRWDYVLALRNTGSLGIYLDRVEVGSQGHEIHGGSMGSERLGSRLEPQETLRWTLSDSFGCTQCDASQVATMMSEGFTKVYIFHGLEDGGRTVRLDVRLRMDSSLGVR